MDSYFVDLDNIMDQIIFPKYKTYIKRTYSVSIFSKHIKNWYKINIEDQKESESKFSAKTLMVLLWMSFKLDAGSQT